MGVSSIRSWCFIVKRTGYDRQVYKEVNATYLNVGLVSTSCLRQCDWPHGHVGDGCLFWMTINLDSSYAGVPDNPLFWPGRETLSRLYRSRRDRVLCENQVWSERLKEMTDTVMLWESKGGLEDSRAEEDSQKHPEIPVYGFQGLFSHYKGLYEY